MRTLKLFSFLLIFCVQGVSAQSKGSSPTDWLTGFWVMDTLRTIKSIRLEDRTPRSSFEKQDKDRIFSSLGTRTLFLRKDKSFVFTFGNSNWVSKMEGKWDFQDSLLVLSSNKGNQYFLFERLNSNLINLESVSSQKSLLQKLYFVRKNEK